MADYNDYEFNQCYKKYHENDNTLVCLNNTLYYNGDDKTIYGMIAVRNNERVVLNMFNLARLNVNQWQMEAHQLFFYIRETVKLEGVDIRSSIIDIQKLASKRYLDEEDKLPLNYIVDYYNALKTIEVNLSGNLWDSLNLIKNMFDEIKTMNGSDITPGYKLIYEKLFGELKENLDSSNDQTNSRGNARTRYDGNKPKPHITPIYQESNEYDNQKFNNAAFISVVALVILILAIVIGAMTYIFS